MEYGKAFSFITEDPNWVGKLAVAALLMVVGGIIPVLPMLVLLGFMLDVTRGVARGEPLPMPQWDGIEQKLKQGFNVFVIGFLYRAPLILLVACMLMLVGATLYGVGVSSDSRGGSSGLEGLFTLLPTLVLCGMCLALAYGSIATLMSHAATIAYLHSGKLSDAFQLREVWGLMQRYLGDFVMLWLTLWIAGLIGGLLAIVTCGLGWLAIGPWLMFAEAHLLGQVARKAFPPMADALVPVPVSGAG